jgi:transposase-like protein
MKRKRYAEEQIAYALRQAESGTKVVEIFRKMGVSEQTFYTWAYRNGLRLDFIRPGEPVENAYIESFNGRLRGECLNFEIYLLDRGCSPKLLASSV